jgi:hypothetical protein
MKSTIINNDGYRYLVEVREIDRPKGYIHVKFSTEWDGARRDGSEQKQFEIFLSAQQLANLKDLL